MADAHNVRDELRKCINDYVRRWRVNRTGDASAAELVVMACVLSDKPLPIPEAMH
jgi:hypothetical protein